MLRVYESSGATSEATMFSPSPRPITSGGPCFAAMIVPGSSAASITSA